jgi:hypothetical protein
LADTGEPQITRRPLDDQFRRFRYDPQDVGVGVLSGQPVCKRREHERPTCGFYVPVQEASASPPARLCG